MRHRRGLLLAALAVLWLSACDGEPAPTPTVTPRADYRLGLVTDVGSVRDGTFNEFAHRGAQRAAQDYGLNYTFRESIDETHYAIHIADLLDDNRNIIVTVGFLMTGVTLAAAQENPDVYFIGVDQFYDEPPPNLVGLQFREDEGGFLAGALAGMMTESNLVGVLGGMEIPPVVRYVNGFVNGVHYVNPQAEALQVYAGSFTDAEAGREIARDWVEQGVDVLFGAAGLTGSAGILQASQLGAWVIGVDQDEYRTTFSDGTVDGAARLLTTAIKRVDTGVYKMVAAVLNGEFEGGIVTLAAADCGIAFAPFHEASDAVPEGIQDRLEAVWRALAGGTLHTGASGAEGERAPAPLAGINPPVADDAPTLADCEL